MSHLSVKRQIFEIAVILGVMMSMTACRAATLGGKTPAQTFQDPQVLALVEAANRGDVEEVQRLAAKGVDVNASGVNGATPLLWAVHSDSLKGIEAFLRAGADPNAKLAHTDGATVLELVAGSHDEIGPKVLSLMLHYGGEPNLPVSDPAHNHSLLAIAAAQGQLDNVKVLLAAGADINAHSEERGGWAGRSAIDSALSSGSYDIVLFFLENGYRYRLDSVAAGTQTSLVSPDMEPYRQKVIAWLMAHDVKYPAYEERRK